MLDTQLAVWAVLDDPRLGSKAADVILTPGVEIFVSTVSLWEIAIKHKLAPRRDPIPISSRRARHLFGLSHYRILPVTADHAVGMDDLDLLHADPFDRLLVAQAIAEPMRLLTRDQRLREYTDLVELV